MRQSVQKHVPYLEKAQYIVGVKRSRRKKLTGAQEHVLYTLVRLCGEQPQRLKLSILANKAKVHVQTAKLAVHRLNTEGLITLDRTAKDGPDSVFTIAITARARTIAASLVLANEHEYLPISQ